MTEHNFNLDRELRRLTRALTTSIRSQKQKNEVAQEYEMPVLVKAICA